MSGHSKWANIKHRKGAQDAKRAKVFSRITKSIIVAVQNGGTDPETNSALKLALTQGRKDNMPKDNIERAVKRGSGEGGENRMEEVVYEGLSADNVAMLILCTTDSTNRTVSEIKNIFKKAGGKCVPSGSLSFQFEHVGMITVALGDIGDADIDDTALVAIDAGAKDVSRDGHIMIIETEPHELHRIRDVLDGKEYSIDDARLVYVGTQPTTLTAAAQERYDIFRESIEEHDDVQDIFDNYEKVSS